MSGTVPREDDEAMATMYTIQCSNGQRMTGYESYEAAVEACRAEWGEDCSIGHDGDLADGGDRTLVWADEASSVDDDGARAVASIVEAQS